MNLRMKILCIAALGAGSAALQTPAAATSVDRQIEERCDVQAHNGRELQTIEMRDLHVLGLGAGDSFAPSLPRGTQAIVCLRSSITPAAYDDKVLALGIPLIIVELGQPHRLGVLEVNDGAFRYRMMEGTLPAADQAAVQTRLEEYRSRLAAHSG